MVWTAVARLRALGGVESSPQVPSKPMAGYRVDAHATSTSSLALVSSSQ